MIFTGTSAIDMAKKHAKRTASDHWRIFIFNQYDKESQMKKGTWVLYQIEVIGCKVTRYKTVVSDFIVCRIK